MEKGHQIKKAHNYMCTKFHDCRFSSCLENVSWYNTTRRRQNLQPTLKSYEVITLFLLIIQEIRHFLSLIHLLYKLR
jgi:hypothetical protein